MARKKRKENVSAFNIILVILVVLALITFILPNAQFNELGEIINGSGVVKAKFSDFLMSPILGFENTVDICMFFLILEGFLFVVQKTGALSIGINKLVKKLNEKELILIPILMAILSIGGTTYVSLEETVGFYTLFAFAMVAAGMDSLIAVSIVLFGAGSGVIGSTINPLTIGNALNALPDGIVINKWILFAIGIVLWIVSLSISMYFVMKYAKKVKEDEGSTFLSVQEQKKMEKFKVKDFDKKDIDLTLKQKITLWLFGITFFIMIIGFIPWNEFNITFFDSWTGFITGSPLGSWSFYEATLWFLIMGMLIGIINKFTFNEIIDEFINGAKDILSVVFIVAAASGISALMQQTYLDNFVIYNVIEIFKGSYVALFTPCNYILHAILSIVVPAVGDLTSVSIPAMVPLISQYGYNVETIIMTIISSNGLANLITPTCGAIMAGLALAKVKYTTWMKWAFKVVIIIGLANILILSFASVIF